MQKNVFTKAGRVCLLLMLFLSTLLNAQTPFSHQAYNDNRTFALDSEGKPIYVERELMVHFQPNYVLTHNVDDLNLQYGSLDTFLEQTAIDQLESQVNDLLNISDVRIKRIYTRLTTQETHSTSRIGRSVPIFEHWASFTIQLPVGVDEELVLDRWKRGASCVQYLHLNYVCNLYQSQVPNDALYLSKQNSLHDNPISPEGHINVEEAWTYTTGKSTIKVGIIDSGVDYEHDDFNDECISYIDNCGNISHSKVVEGRDYYLKEDMCNIPADEFAFGSHGTMVAGIVGALRNNREFIAGIAGGKIEDDCEDGVDLYGMNIFNVLEDEENIEFAWCALLDNAVEALVEGSIEAVNYGYGLHIMNNSWGVDLGDLNVVEEKIFELKNAVHTAFQNDCVVVAARGNAGSDTATYPSCYQDDWLMNITGSNALGKYNTSSSWGNSIDVIAPVSNGWTLQNNNGNGGTGGTSSAAPHVSGVAALLLSQNSALSAEDVENIIQLSADNKEFPGEYDDFNGWGLLNAGAALKAINPLQYAFQHYTVEVIASSASQLVMSDVTLKYGESLYGSQMVDVVCDVYRIQPIHFPTPPIGAKPIDAWIRNNQCNLYGLPVSVPDPDNPTQTVERIEYYANSSAQLSSPVVFLEGYTYHIKSLITNDGQTFNFSDFWLPIKLDETASFDYTLYSKYPTANAKPQITSGFEPQVRRNYSNFFANYSIEETANLSMSLYNLQGQLIEETVSHNLESGMYQTPINTDKLTTGVYLLNFKLETENGHEMKTLKLSVVN